MKGRIDWTIAGPGRGQPWVAAGLNLRIAKPTRPPNPDGVDPTNVRPLQGRNDLAAPFSVGFTYGYSPWPASRDGNGAGRIEIVLILAPMGQRPRNARRSIPDPGGVVFPWAACRKMGVTSPEIDPASAGSDLVGGASSGGVAPGYCMDPLRGSGMDRSEGVLGAQKAGKAPSGYARHGPSALTSRPRTQCLLLSPTLAANWGRVSRPRRLELHLIPMLE